MRSSYVLPLLLASYACESDRSTGGGGVQMFGSIDTGVPRPSDGGANTRDGNMTNGSGVDPSKYLDELTPAEVMAVCEWSIAKQGGPGETMCGEMLTVNVDTVAECVADGQMGAHCRVSLVEACMNSLMGDPCRILSTLECSAFIQCATGGNPTDAGVEDASDPDSGPPDLGGS